MATYTPEELAKVVANLERQGARQSDEVRAAVATAPTPPAKSARTLPSAATRTQEPVGGLGTEAGMHGFWQSALADFGDDLPAMEREYLFAAPWRQWRFDYAIPARMVAIELDGMAWQAGGGHHNTDADREKLNSAAALGWRVLHFTSKALRTDPAACIALVRRALER